MHLPSRRAGPGRGAARPARPAAPTEALMKILYVSRDYAGYSGAYYQHQFYEALCAQHEVAFVDLAHGPAVVPQVDWVVYGFGWWEEGAPPAVSVPPAPVAMCLTKEYKELRQKVAYSRRQAQVVFTASLPVALSEHFVWLPFGVRQDVFAGSIGSYHWDVGFSGSSQARWGLTLREELQAHLCRRSHRLYWSGREGTLEEYAARVRRSRLWLATPGPAGVVSPRYFEVMATGTTALICPRSPDYGSLFVDGVDCRMFSSLDELDEVIAELLRDDDRRLRLVTAAQEAVAASHTWRHRVDAMTAVLEQG